MAFLFSRGSSQPRGSNPGLPHCRRILYQLSHKASPRILESGAFPFSRGSSRPRNRTGVSCIAGRFFTDWPIREAWISIYWVYMSIYIFLALKKEQHSKRNGRMIRGRQMILSDGIMTCWDHGLLKKQHTSFLRINRFYQLTEHRSNPTEKRKKRIYFPVGWILNGCFFT